MDVASVSPTFEYFTSECIYPGNVPVRKEGPLLLGGAAGVKEVTCLR